MTGLLIGLTVGIPALWLIVRDQLAQHRTDHQHSRDTTRGTR